MEVSNENKVSLVRLSKIFSSYVNSEILISEFWLQLRQFSNIDQTQFEALPTEYKTHPKIIGIVSFLYCVCKDGFFAHFDREVILNVIEDSYTPKLNEPQVKEVIKRLYRISTDAFNAFFKENSKNFLSELLQFFGLYKVKKSAAKFEEIEKIVQEEFQVVSDLANFFIPFNFVSFFKSKELDSWISLKFEQEILSENSDKILEIVDSLANKWFRKNVQDHSYLDFSQVSGFPKLTTIDQFTGQLLPFLQQMYDLKVNVNVPEGVIVTGIGYDYNYPTKEQTTQKSTLTELNTEIKAKIEKKYKKLFFAWVDSNYSMEKSSTTTSDNAGSMIIPSTPEIKRKVTQFYSVESPLDRGMKEARFFFKHNPEFVNKLKDYFNPAGRNECWHLIIAALQKDFCSSDCFDQLGRLTLLLLFKKITLPTNSIKEALFVMGEVFIAQMAYMAQLKVEEEQFQNYIKSELHFKIYSFLSHDLKLRKDSFRKYNNLIIAFFTHILLGLWSFHHISRDRRLDFSRHIFSVVFAVYAENNQVNFLADAYQTLLSKLAEKYPDSLGFDLLRLIEGIFTSINGSVNDSIVYGPLVKSIVFFVCSFANSHNGVRSQLTYSVLSSWFEEFDFLFADADSNKLLDQVGMKLVLVSPIILSANEKQDMLELFINCFSSVGLHNEATKQGQLDIYTNLSNIFSMLYENKFASNEATKQYQLNRDTLLYDIDSPWGVKNFNASSEKAIDFNNAKQIFESSSTKKIVHFLYCLANLDKNEDWISYFLSVVPAISYDSREALRTSDRKGILKNISGLANDMWNNFKSIYDNKLRGSGSNFQALFSDQLTNDFQSISIYQMVDLHFPDIYFAAFWSIYERLRNKLINDSSLYYTWSVDISQRLVRFFPSAEIFSKFSLPQNTASFYDGHQDEAVTLRDVIKRELEDCWPAAIDGVREISAKLHKITSLNLKALRQIYPMENTKDNKSSFFKSKDEEYVSLFELVVGLKRAIIAGLLGSAEIFLISEDWYRGMLATIIFFNKSKLDQFDYDLEQLNSANNPSRRKGLLSKEKLDEEYSNLLGLMSPNVLDEIALDLKSVKATQVENELESIPKKKKQSDPFEDEKKKVLKFKERLDLSVSDLKKALSEEIKIVNKSTGLFGKKYPNKNMHIGYIQEHIDKFGLLPEQTQFITMSWLFYAQFDHSVYALLSCITELEATEFRRGYTELYFYKDSESKLSDVLIARRNLSFFMLFINNLLVVNDIKTATLKPEYVIKQEINVNNNSEKKDLEIKILPQLFIMDDFLFNLNSILSEDKPENQHCKKLILILTSTLFSYMAKLISFCALYLPENKIAQQKFQFLLDFLKARPKSWINDYPKVFPTEHDLGSFFKRMVVDFSIMLGSEKMNTRFYELLQPKLIPVLKELELLATPTSQLMSGKDCN